VTRLKTFKYPMLMGQNDSDFDSKKVRWIYVHGVPN